MALADYGLRNDLRCRRCPFRNPQSEIRIFPLEPFVLTFDFGLFDFWIFDFFSLFTRTIPTR